MGRKGVSKQKRAKGKSAPVSSGRKAEKQPERVTEKGKASQKGSKDH